MSGVKQAARLVAMMGSWLAEAMDEQMVDMSECLMVDRLENLLVEMRGL